MATNRSVTVENLITCVICRESFKDPRLLPCSHTYCWECIERMASENKDQFECPLRDGFVAMKEDISSLPLNRAIRDLVELHDDAIQGLKTKINIDLQSIQSSLNDKINETDILLNIIDNNSKFSRQKMTETMAEIRRVIDKHEKDMLRNILKTEKEQKKRVEDYKIPLTNELQRLNMQKVSFEMLSSMRNRTKLLEAKERFDDYVNKTNEKLKLLPMPTVTDYFLEGVDQLQSLKEKILQCGKYVEISRYHNPQLEKFISENGTKQELDLKLRNLTDSDMIFVADMLRNSTVQKYFLRITAFLE
ncbi:unnamed protein product [Rotaria sp. Silwood1]|nr:unnamed protein product [Rotaria sp. Silwood1]